MYVNVNEAGEPLIDAAALRVEAALDAQSAEERWEQDFYDDDYTECELDYDLDLHDGHVWCYTHDCTEEECSASEE